jgi:replicative DNA helicase
MATAAARSGVPVLIFSLEMSDKQLMMRAIAAEAGVNLQRLRNGDMQNEHWQRIVSTIHRLTELPISIEDTSGLTMRDIHNITHTFKRREGVGLVFTDYLGLIADDGNEEMRNRQLSAMTKGHKRLAKDLDIPVAILSQLNRKVEERADKRPMPSDLRESGAIEEDSDVILFIYRPEVYGITVDEDGMPTEGTAELIVSKQRNGPTDIIKCEFRKEQALFTDAIDYTAPAHYEARGGW